MSNYNCNPMCISDLFSDAELFFYDEEKNQYFNLKIKSIGCEGFSDEAVTIILSKRERVYKKDLFDPKRPKGMMMK